MDTQMIKESLDREMKRRGGGKAALAGCLGGGGSGPPGVTCASGDLYDGSMKIGDLCSFNRAPTAVHDVAGQTAATIQVEPQNSSWFCPLGVAVKVRNSTDGNVDMAGSVLITSVSVQRCPQLDFDNAAPDATTRQYLVAREWDPDARDGCACRVDWDCFSNLANSWPLRVVIFNDNPAGILVDVSFDVIGEAINACAPKGRAPGSRRARMGGSAAA